MNEQAYDMSNGFALDVDSVDTVFYANALNGRSAITALRVAEMFGAPAHDIRVELSITSLGHALSQTWTRTLPELGTANLTTGTVARVYVCSHTRAADRQARAGWRLHSPELNALGWRPVSVAPAKLVLS